MMKYPYQSRIILGGICFQFHLEFAESRLCFQPYEVELDDLACVDLCVPEEEWAYVLPRGLRRNGQIEASLLTALVSDYLLQHDSCIFHSVAFRTKDDAWLICGPSGVGKSTQIRNLQSISPSSFSIICGDRPVLKQMENGEILVLPSPWNGKENWKGAEAAPLKGIICLQRGESNELEPLSNRDAVIPVFQSLIQTGKTSREILLSAAFTEKIIRACPVWRLTSYHVPESTKLLYATLFA